MQDTRLMKSAGTTSISIALRSIVVAAFGLVLMFMTSPLLSALTLACLPPLLVSFRIYSKLNMRYTAEQLTASAQAATVAEECFGSIRTVSLPCVSVLQAPYSSTPLHKCS
jgi:ATP-binding cassette subfamily B protein